MKTLSTYMGHATITLDRYGYLMPSSEVEARALWTATSHDTTAVGTPTRAIACTHARLRLAGGKAQRPTVRTVIAGLAVLASVMSLVVEPSQVHRDFYAVLATTIPILLFALLVRLAGLRDVIVETFNQVRDYERKIVDMREKAHPQDSKSHAKLDELLAGRKKNARELEGVAPRILAGLVAALLIAAMGEVACLSALAMNESTAATFYISSLGTAVVAYSMAVNEITIFRLSFGQRGLLLPARHRKPAKP